MKTVSVSVIIPTYNGEKKIGVLLNALQNQTFKDFEVIVAIDGSQDKTEDMITQNNWGNLNIRVVVQENRGRSSIRNFGSGYANGNILVFYDDDMIPNRSSVLSHVEFHQKNEKSILGGSTFENLNHMKSDFQRYKAELSKKWVNKYSNGLNLLDSEEIFLSAANFSISKSLFKLLGGFDENLNDAEDLDLALRAHQLGATIYFDKSNIAWHNDLITCRSYIKRLRQYEEAHKELQGGYLNRNKKIKKRGLIKKIIFKVFSREIWVDIIDGFNLLRILPRKIRYKLYDVITTGLSTQYSSIEIDHQLRQNQ